MKKNIKAENTKKINVEWGVDMDSFSIGGLKTKGRCQTCWGGLLGRTKDLRFTGIKCRICKEILEGSDAEKEEERMIKESVNNSWRMGLGFPPAYSSGTFAIKIFPELERVSEEQLEKRIAVQLKKRGPARKPKKITRSNFPKNFPGLLFLQAEILMSGVGGASVLRGASIADFPHAEVKDDGSVALYYAEDIDQDPLGKGYPVMSKMGINMIESMNSAFACELAMKAICLTYKDEAKKIHDLFELFNDLPEQSHKRIKVDYPEIETCLKKARETFGKWRYFEERVKEKSLQTMINADDARAISKAARVILDEGTIMGLQGRGEMQAKRKVRFSKTRTMTKHNIRMNIFFSESPPKKTLEH